MDRTAFEASREKRANVVAEEASGNVVDSMAVRLALMRQVRSGDITLGEAQARLRKLQQGAKAAGKLTRDQAFRRG